MFSTSGTSGVILNKAVTDAHYEEFGGPALFRKAGVYFALAPFFTIKATVFFWRQERSDLPEKGNKFRPAKDLLP